MCEKGGILIGSEERERQKIGEREEGDRRRGIMQPKKKRMICVLKFCHTGFNRALNFSLQSPLWMMSC